MSKSDAWMPLYVGDYLADTMHLGAAEHGAYLLLLMHYWRNGPLPDDDRQLAAIARVDRRLWASEVGPVVRAFFEVRDGRLHQRRMDAERARAEQVSSKRRAAADARWQHRASTSDANASANAEQKDTHAGARPSASPSQSQDTSSLRSDGAPAPPSPPDARSALWTEGLGRLRRLTGLADRGARSLMGRMLGACRDDCALLGLILHEAEDARVVDPVAWIEASIQARTGHRSASGAPRGSQSGIGEAMRRMRASPAAPMLDGIAEEVCR